MSSLKALGIMSGTSLDGADFVKIKVHKKNLECEYLGMESFDFPSRLKKKLFQAVQDELKISEVCDLDFELGQFYAQCFKQLPVTLKKVDVIGLHGQTIFHRGGQSTLQIGQPGFLSLVSKKKIVSQFRTSDIVVSGQGAPLAPFFHQVVFGQKNKTISLHNLGGISNLSLIQNKVLKFGFDTGPANMLMDEEMRRSTKASILFDKEGQIAARGKVNLTLLMDMLQHEYFSQKPPKSCGREQFGKDFYNHYKSRLDLLTLEDKMATLTELTVQTISKAYLQLCKPQPSEIIFCGGGSKNKFLISRIDKELESIKVSTVDDYGWPSQSIEGAAFALLAACRIWEIPTNLPTATGAKKKVLLGQITQL